jgi:putative nucleotidyltransferase with HDIG domain
MSTYTYSHDYILSDPNVKTKQDLIDLLQHRHFRSYVHVSALACAIAYEMEANYLFDFEELNYISLAGQAGLFHDIGKLGFKEEIPFSIIFDDQMWKEMKKHPQGGAEILQKIGAEQMLIDAACYHHCDYDGLGGYPSDFKRGEQLSVYARIVKLADSLDAAMDTSRLYKKAVQPRALFAHFVTCPPLFYDPKTIYAFRYVHERVLAKCGGSHPTAKQYINTLIQVYELPKQNIDDVLPSLYEACAN